MECGQIQKRMPAYVDGMDSPEERRLIDQHLPSCPSCRKALEEYQKIRERLLSLEEVEPPPGFAQRILAQVEEGETKGGILKKLFYPLHVKIPIQAIATIVIAVLAIQVYRSLEPQKAAVQQYGVTVPAARLSHTLRGVRPRARMSSENEVSFAKFLCTRVDTKLPEP